MNRFQNYIIILLLATAVGAFHEESVFEDEDIYNQALPTVPSTGITVPGTKWCGPGNTAADYNDLGIQRETDTCCRQHDHCEEILESKQSLYGLNNSDLFPIMKCTCEQIFLNCLQSIDNMFANTLGRVYFGTRKKCFANGYPIVRCKQHQNGTYRQRCILYEVDKQQPKIWQFYDMPFYSYKR
ncbi:phospholipase A2 [Zeugodacus cucurbitae]|uniref:Phospholipase A2 n=1 Tax=Zeugodacus cucurbitae TaxID=28588 RepID=A0A0A1X5K6_ZEUCU|nr:phospholipase A2 [Zeugodacus cucurbitae]